MTRLRRIFNQNDRSAVIAESPFRGEGHRKIWARLRTQKQVRTSLRRVLRVMREAALLAPTRQTEPIVERPHEGRIVADTPNVMWGTDATATVTPLDGHAMIFAAIDHCTAECVGIHAAIQGTRFETLEPIRQGMRLHFGGVAAGVATGLAMRHGHVVTGLRARRERLHRTLLPNPEGTTPLGEALP
jgi:hypothetical protein